MPELSQWFPLIIFVLGFVTGTITVSLVYEIRRKDKQPRSRTQNLTSSAVQNEIESSVQQVVPSITAETSGTSAKKEPVEWVPGPWDTQPQRINMNPVDALVRRTQPIPGSEKPQKTSIAEEIDEILQENLARSEHAGRMIRLHALPDRSLEVIVDGNRYGAIGEVPDQDAIALIQSAVTEWQRRISQRG